MKLTAKEVIERYNNSYSIKATWDTEYRKVFEYCMPSRDGYQKAVGPEKVLPEFQDRREKLFSSVGEQSANDFVNTMQELLFPPMSNWISIKAASRIPKDKREQVNEELDKFSFQANEYKNISSFDLAISEFCFDLFAGTACLSVLPGTPLEPLRFKAIPLREYTVEEGPDGVECAVYRKFTMKREFLKQQWKELKNMKLTTKEAMNDVEIIEATKYDYDLNVWHYLVVDMAASEILVEREYKTSPFLVLRWNKMAGEPYGRGPGLTAINDIKTLNLIKMYGLRNFAFNTPPLLVQEDAMLDVDGLELTPWSLNVVPNTQTSIVPLQIQTDHNIESFRTQELSLDIKRNTYASTLPNPGGRELTATEVRALQNEMRRSFNSVFGRLLIFQTRLIRRIFDVLQDVKIISDEFDVMKIDGLMFKVNMITPMKRILDQGEANAILGAASTLVGFDNSGSVLNQYMVLDEMIPNYLELAGVPNKFIRTKEEAQQIQREQAQAQAASVQAQTKLDVDAANAKEMGKAAAKAMEKEVV